MPGTIDSGEPLFAVDTQQRIVSWNEAMEELTGVEAEEAVGGRCWQVVGGADLMGRPVCQLGCQYHDCIVQGLTVGPRRVFVNTAWGRRRVLVSMLGVLDEEEPLVLHLLSEP